MNLKRIIIPPETAGARGGPAAASWPHLQNLRRGNTQRLWWSGRACRCCKSTQRVLFNELKKIYIIWANINSLSSFKPSIMHVKLQVYLVKWKRFLSTYSSPQRTALSTPTAAVVCRSKPWPMWSAWALVRSSNSISLGSLVLGRYCRFFISLVDLQ